MEKTHFEATDKREAVIHNIEEKLAMLEEETSHLREDNFHLQHELNRALDSERHLRKENNHLRAL